jgi:hypothetical protein
VFALNVQGEHKKLMQKAKGKKQKAKSEKRRADY